MSDSIETTVRGLLGDIAADADISSVPADQDLREELDLDSMDILHFAVALSEAFGIEVPERDYRQLSTIQRTASYVREHGKDRAAAEKLQNQRIERAGPGKP